jgi:ABC-2 type transport system permease protein
MTGTLVLKLLRDLRLPLAVVAALLAGFQCLWAKVTQRVIGQLAPFFNKLAGFAGLSQSDIQDVLFEGPGRIARTLIGGDYLALDNAMDLLSIGYVHPLVQTIFCVWAVGRAAGAVAGEIDRGTMELLLAQPLPRWRLLWAHFCVDLITIPVLCLSLWGGTWLGTWLTGPFHVEETKLPKLPARRNVVVELGPLTVRVEDPVSRVKATQGGPNPMTERDRLRVEPARFGRALPLVGGLIFAVSGYTMWLSAAGRFRWRVLGVAVLVTLLQFLVNLVGQLWDVMAPLRPFTIFYYYQPQQAVIGGAWGVPLLAVLYGVGLAGYALALWTFRRRDLPAPL